METLPYEMLELIVRKLSPRDLAHSSAVCRSWYKTLNQDWIWAPYCDPELEEPLQTIPSVATPTFEIPEAKTLPQISRWKWAFLREKHLWMNWRPEKVGQLKEENIKNKDVLDVDFFSDTLIVVWYPDKIEIVDVSVVPAVIVAETGTSVNLCSKVVLDATDKLLVADTVTGSINVFNVDIENQSITLKYNLDNIYFDKSQIAKDNIYFFHYDEGEKMKILDLNTGKILKEEITFPEETNENKITFVQSIICSPTSDFVVVEFLSENPCEFEDRHVNVLVYSLKQFKYLPSPEIKAVDSFGQILLHDHWIALQQNPLDRHKINIYNISITEGVVFSDEIGLPPLQYMINGAICNGCFVITDTLDGYRYSYVGIYFPTSKTLTAIDVKPVSCFEVINNKFIAIESKKGPSHIHGRYVVSETVLLRVLNQKVEKCGFSFGLYRDWKANPSFTKVVKANPSFTKVVHKNFYAPWYISHFW